MALCNILVHLDSRARTAERLHLACTVAAREGARLVGVFGQVSQPHQVGIVAKWPSEQYVEAAAASQAQFAEATAGLDKAEWTDLNRGSEQEILRTITDLSRHFDLVIIGQTEEAGKRLVPADMAEQLIAESGRPVLVIPFVGHYTDVGHRPFIACTDVRPAARALNDALPLVADDATALVVSILRNKNTGHESIGQVVTHLTCHGIAAAAETVIVEDFGLMDLLLNRASEHGADLLVIGAFGGYGYPLLNRGSGTRFMLRHMTVPVLFSH